jgi:hypothetical protein
MKNLLLVCRIVQGHSANLWHSQSSKRNFSLHPTASWRGLPNAAPVNCYGLESCLLVCFESYMFPKSHVLGLGPQGFVLKRILGLWPHLSVSVFLCLCHSSSLSFLATMRWGVSRLLYHMLLLWCFTSPQAQSNGTKGPWTKTSETMRLYKSFLFQVAYLRYFLTAMEIWLPYPSTLLKQWVNQMELEADAGP